MKGNKNEHWFVKTGKRFCETKWNVDLYNGMLGGLNPIDVNVETFALVFGSFEAAWFDHQLDVSLTVIWFD